MPWGVLLFSLMNLSDVGVLVLVGFRERKSLGAKKKDKRGCVLPFEA